VVIVHTIFKKGVIMKDMRFLLLFALALVAFNGLGCGDDNKGGPPVAPPNGATGSIPTEKYALTGAWNEIGSSDVSSRKIIFTDNNVVSVLSYDTGYDILRVGYSLGSFELKGNTLSMNSTNMSVLFSTRDTLTISGFYGESDFYRDGDIKLYREYDTEKASLKNVIWKLVGIVDIQKKSLTELSCGEWEDDEWEWTCYTLVFLTDNEFASRSSSNREIGIYNADYATNTISIRILGGTERCETEDGSKWKDIMGGTTETIEKFELGERELKLYYNNNKNYLLFKSL